MSSIFSIEIDLVRKRIKKISLIITEITIIDILLPWLDMPYGYYQTNNSEGEFKLKIVGPIAIYDQYFQLVYLLVKKRETIVIRSIF